jgi:type I restriction enzyme S subunit
MRTALKPGYKQTEMGVIPEDWEVATLNRLSFMKSGEAITGADIDQFSPYPCYGGNGLRGFTTRFTHDGCYALIGRQGALCGNVLGVEGKFFASEHAVVVTSAPRVDIRWLTFVLGEMNLNRYSESSAQPGLSVSKILSIQVACPPTLVEQQAIADALSDADALIASLEQLIAKKRLIKQGAMQELLTGKKRLPGFNGGEHRSSEIGEIPREWRVVEISKIASVKTGPFGSSLHERDYVDDGTPIITVEHLGERGVLHVNLPMVSKEDRKRLSVYSLEEGDIVFSRVGSVDRNARISNAEQGWLFSGRLLRLRRLEDSVNTQYLSYLFRSEPFKQRVRTVAVGQTMASLNTRILGNVLIVLPYMEEQAAIATILSDIDAEIAALEAKLAKARQVKQGMMQELLTGRIRLV